MKSVPRSFINAAYAIAVGLLLGSCGPDGGTTLSENGSDSGAVGSVQSTRQRASEILTGKDVDRIVERTNKRGGPLTSEEVAQLVTATQRGVLNAYFALYWHHSTDGDPAEAERWFREGLAKGEPNLSAIQGEREKAQAETESDPTKKIQLLTSAKTHFDASLRKGSKLTTASPETIREDLADVERLLSEGR